MVELVVGRLQGIHPSEEHGPFVVVSQVLNVGGYC